VRPPPEHQDHRELAIVDPADACIECGKQAGLFCGTCGFPLCGKHHELGGGFCSKHHHVGGVSVCVYRTEVYVGTWPREESVVRLHEPFEGFHLPHSDDESVPACRPETELRSQELTLDDARARDLDCCADCKLEARHRYALFQRDLREEWRDEG